MPKLGGSAKKISGANVPPNLIWWLRPCIKVISKVLCRYQTLWLTYLPMAGRQQGSLAYLVFTQLRCYCCFSSRTGLLTLLNAVLAVERVC